MSRQEYYLEDSYCKELTSSIETIDTNGIKLKQVLFYPRGGGQPDDRGVLMHNNKSYQVTAIDKTDHGIYLKVDDRGDLQVGDEVNQQIDWDYRYKLMKHHTTLHILSAVVWDKFQAKVTGGTIYHDKARLDFDLQEFNSELAKQLVDEVNKIIQQDHKISISFVNRQEAEQDPDLIRTKINLLPPSITELRLVKIGNVDIQADGGLHVRQTSEIGQVELVKTENKGKGRKRITVSAS